MAADQPLEDYARITFAQGDHGSLDGKTVVDVKKNVEVDLKDNEPKVKAAEGYKFTGWDKELKGKFTEDATITAQYRELKDVEVPDKPTDDKPSEAYAKITFAQGDHGELIGDKNSVFVKKNVEVNLKDNAPEVKPADGYKFTG